jgi:hypothetical protein
MAYRNIQPCDLSGSKQDRDLTISQVSQLLSQDNKFCRNFIIEGNNYNNIFKAAIPNLRGAVYPPKSLSLAKLC